MKEDSFINFIDGKYYAFDFDKILEKVLRSESNGKSKGDNGLKMVESETMEDYNGNEMLTPETRHVRELKAYVGPENQSDNIAYDLFKTIATPILVGDFYDYFEDKPGEDEDEDEAFEEDTAHRHVIVSPSAAVCFNTLLNEGFIKELEVNE